jgi:hypothetical protein
MRASLFTFILFHLASGICQAQLPDTDIWLLDLKKKDSTLTLSGPLNITSRKGYDNQPAFSPDGSYVLYSSIRSDGQSDIYKYDIRSKKTAAFCKTPESEYSPTFTPDWKFISTVRVEKDSAQRLWKFPVGGGEPVLVMNDVDSIGYHCWINNDSIVMFILTDPFTLQLANVKTQKCTIISDSIGKSLARFRYIRSAGCLFIRSRNEKNIVCFTPFRYSAKGKFELSEVIALPDSCEYFAFSNNILFCAVGSKIFKSEMMKDTGWTEIADLASSGILNITRISISANGSQMAIVNASITK